MIATVLDGFTEGLKKHTLFLMNDGSIAIGTHAENRRERIQEVLPPDQALLHWQDAMERHLYAVGIPDASVLVARRISNLRAELFH